MRIQSQLKEQRCVNVGHVVPLLDGVEANFVGGPVSSSEPTTLSEIKVMVLPSSSSTLTRANIPW